jgi:nucleotide-binding universal stress UspA family protein
MFKKLLVAVGGTPDSHAALQLGHVFAEATHAHVVVVRVLPRASEHQAPAVRRELEQLAAQLTRAGVGTQTVLRYGDVADEIIHQARDSGAGLIIMTTTWGGGGLRGLVLGSVPQQVLKRSPVPVLQLRPGRHRIRKPRTVLVPVDGSPGGAVALDIALELARATGAAVDVLEVVTPIPPSSLDVGLGRQWQEDALSSARQYVRRLVGRLHAAGIKAQGRVRLGPVAASIVASATEDDVDLIIVSTHALAGPARAVLGGVANDVVRLALQPVLLVRREPRGRPHLTDRRAPNHREARANLTHAHL